MIFPFNWLALLFVCRKYGHRHAAGAEPGDSGTCARCGFAITWDGSRWQADELF